MLKFVPLGLLPLALFACSSGPWPAPGSAVLSDLEDFEIVPSSAHVSQDGIGTLILGDIMVYDEMSEMALNNIEVEILTGWSGIYVLPESAVKLVQYPQPPADVASGDAVPADYCDIEPADGEIDSNAPDWCSWWWDTDTAAFFEFGSDYAMSPENFQPTYMIGSTNSRGILRFYLYVDSLPNDDGEDFTGSGIWISIGVDALNVAIEVEV